VNATLFFDTHKSCYLKGSPCPPAVPMPSSRYYTSGTKLCSFKTNENCYLPDQALQGTDISQVSVNSTADCHKSCWDTPDCFCWIFEKISKLCWLKSACDSSNRTTTDQDGVISGFMESDCNSK